MLGNESVHPSCYQINSVQGLKAVLLYVTIISIRSLYYIAFYSFII